MRRLRLSGLWFLPVLFLIGCESDNAVMGPGSTHIAFASERGAGQQVYVIAIDGRGLVQVSNTIGRSYSPTWSPDGSLILYHGDSYGDPFSMDIHTVAPDGTGHKNLTNSPDYIDADARWSPDGKRIAFVSNRDQFDSEVYVMNSDGSGQTRLTTSPGTDGGARWSPDGRWLVFSSGRNDTLDLWAMRSDGSDQRRLTRSHSPEYGPEWAPDGSGIAYWGGDLDSTQIYFVTLDGVITQVTHTLYSAETPSWSPDGTKIVYAADDGMHTMNRDGSNGHLIPGTGYWDREPKWSPDGHRIVFVNEEPLPSNTEVFVMKTDGSGRLNLSQNYYWDITPAWEPLGKRWTPRTP
jgi:Tol biopolymer transport system component